jgi:hypothetical protein
MNFIRKPNIDLYPGIVVAKDSELEYESEFVKQSLKDLVFHSVTRIVGKDFDGTYDTTIHLQEGDVLLLDGDRGYIKPVEPVVTVEEAIADLENIKELGGE